MKRIPILLTALIVSFAGMGQTPFATRDSMNVNHINASVLLHGDMWWNPTTEVAACEYPTGSHKHVGFTSGIWMSGYDAGNDLHVAAQTYRQDGNDYWPGPIDGSGSLSMATSTDWAKFFRVTQSDIQTFLSLSTHTTTNTPPSILTWPGTGNTYATGNAGAALTIPAGTNMAPFVDVNGNGLYEPLLGDYPRIRGDQSLWWVFSDYGPTHTQTNGLPLGVEVHVLNYAYSRNTLIDNVVFYEFTVINKSPIQYDSFRLGLHADMDLGYYNDDFIGFDSAHRMGIVYQGSPADGTAGGYPLNSYGYNAPMAGVTLLELPGDSGPTKVPAGSFNYYHNDNSVEGNPTNAAQYNYYLRSRIRNGNHRYNGFTPGMPWDTTGPSVNYVLPGDPSDTAQWSECAEGAVPGDRRFIITSNDLTLPPGGTVKISMALVVTDTNQGGCPLVNFHDIKTVADSAWVVYWNPPAPVSIAISNVNQAPQLTVYPNPASTILTAELSAPATANTTFQVFNSIGQLMPVHVQVAGNKATADIAQLPAGVYQLRCSNGGNSTTARFVKQ